VRHRVVKDLVVDLVGHDGQAVLTGEFGNLVQARWQAFQARIKP
jgi:hypothetical protein